MSFFRNLSGYQKVDATVPENRFYFSLYRFALCLTASHSDAVDLVQQIFVRLNERRLQIQDYSTIRCWLFAALHRYCRLGISNRRHSLKREPALDVNNSIPRNPRHSGFPAARALVNEAYRPALSLYLENFSVREIAHILQIPLDAVRSRLVKGGVQLSLILKADGEPRAVIEQLRTQESLRRPPQELCGTGTASVGYCFSKS